jgi:hypothetical protein
MNLSDGFPGLEEPRSWVTGSGGDPGGSEREGPDPTGSTRSGIGDCVGSTHPRRRLRHGLIKKAFFRLFLSFPRLAPTLLVFP